MMQVSNKHEKPVKKKTLTLKERLEILEKIKDGEKLPDLANKYGVHTSTISRIKTSKQLILYHKEVLKSCDGNLSKRRFKGTEQTFLEKSLYQWFTQRRTCGLPLTDNMLREKAKHFNELLNGSDNLKFSSGWLDKFKQRHGVQCISTHEEKLSTDTASTVVSKDNLKNVISTSGLSLDHIYNTEEKGDMENLSDEDYCSKISVPEAFKATSILINYYQHNNSQLSKHLLPVLQICYEDLIEKSLSF